MEESYHFETALVLANIHAAKHAALLFDRIIPINVPDVPQSIRVAKALPGSWDDRPEVAFKKILELLERKSGRPLTDLRIGGDFVLVENGVPNLAEFIRSLEGAYLAGDDFTSHIRTAADRLGYQEAAVLTGATDPSTCNSVEKIAVSIANARVVDSARATWRQIVEFREDQDARQQLRNMRIDLWSSYQGKEPSFIQDDIGRRIDAYQLAAEKHGFELIVQTVKAVFTRHSFAAGAALVSTLLLAGHTITIAVGAGGIAPLVSGAVTAASAQRNRSDWSRSHPLAYLVAARETLKD